MTEPSPVMQQEILNVDSRLAKVHGPFAWDIVKSAKAISAERRQSMFEMVIDAQDYFPELLLIYYLMQVVEEVKRNKLPSALERLIVAEKTLADVRGRATMKKVKNALQHIFIETKCHVMKEQGQLTKVIELLEEIIDVDDMNKTELAMLNGCHCSALSLYTSDNEEGMKCANKAIEYEPENGKWHLWLARFRRKQRKRECFYHAYKFPGEDEALAFTKAYQLSPNVHTGIALARMYRESNKSDKAEEIYKAVHALQPISYKIQLQLALGFIRFKNCILAKECLHYVAEKMPGSPAYMHYMAIFEEKCNHNHKAALQYYERTTELFNNVAEEQYMICKKKVEPDWDPLPYLLDLPKKYEGYAHQFTQPMHIQIGLYYLYEKHNVIAACEYLAEAIKMNPDNKQLRRQYLIFHKFEPVNVYHILTNEVEAALHNAAAIYDEEAIGILNRTLQLCRENCEDLSVRTRSSTTQTQMSRATKSCRNYSRGSSFHEKSTNWREEKPSTATRGFPNSNSRSSGDVLSSPKKDLGSSYKRNYTSWRSEGRTTRVAPSNPHPSRTYCDQADIQVADRTRDIGVRGATSTKSHDKKDESGAETSCRLVKSVKDINL